MPKFTCKSLVLLGVALAGCSAPPQAALGGVTLDAAGDGSGAHIDAAQQELFELERFSDPPSQYAPGLRWVWPGGAVEDDMIQAQIARAAEVGYGMVEIQPLLLGLEQEAVSNPRIRSVGTEAYLRHVQQAVRAAHAHRLSCDLTLGSGWPSGGPRMPLSAAEQQLLWTRVDVTGPRELNLALPEASEPSWVAQSNELLANIRIAGPFDKRASVAAVIAVPLLDESASPPQLGAAVDISEHVAQGRLRWSVPAGPHVVLVLHQNSTSHIVFKAAFPGQEDDALVIDHLGPLGVRWLIDQQVTPWLDTLADARPDAFFVDSLELVGELPWTADLAGRYAERTGHAAWIDAPFWFRQGGESKYVDITRDSSPAAFASADAAYGLRAREDYEVVRAQAFEREFVKPLAAALDERGVALRLQAHGGWGALLDDYASTPVPEAESLFHGGSFDFLKLAASAAHVSGQRMVSSESFVTLNITLDPTLFDEATLWRQVGLAYSAGINRPVHSALLYPHVLSNGAAWNPFDPDPSAPGGITLRIEPDAPNWAFLGSFNRAQARIGYALSRGTPRTDIAWLMNERELRDHAHLALGNQNMYGPESAHSRTLRSAGYSYDRISLGQLGRAEPQSGVLRVGAASYRALLIDHGQILDTAVLERVVAALDQQVPVLWIGEPPVRTPGLRDAPARDAQLAALWTDARARLLVASDLASALARLRAGAVLPEIEAPVLLEPIATVQRETDNGRIVWLYNEAVLAQSFLLRMRPGATSALLLDPENGSAQPLTLSQDADGSTCSLDLPAGRARLLWLPNP